LARCAAYLSDPRHFCGKQRKQRLDLPQESNQNGTRAEKAVPLCLPFLLYETGIYEQTNDGEAMRRKEHGKR